MFSSSTSHWISNSKASEREADLEQQPHADSRHNIDIRMSAHKAEHREALKTSDTPVAALLYD